MYDYKCSKCGGRESRLLPLALYNSEQRCWKCGEALEKQVAAPRVLGDYPAYNCPITGELIEGRKAHRENLARHGCRVLEPGEVDRAKRFATQREVDFEQRLDETVEKEIAALPPEKLEALACELDHGVTATVDRGTPKF